MTAKNLTPLHAALTHHRAGEYDRAQQLYKVILEKDPDDVNALHLLGVLLNGRGQYDSGIPFILRALELAPDMIEARYNVGNAFSKLGRYTDAISAYDEVTRSSPKHTNAWLNKGDAYRAIGKFSNAEASYRRAIELDPGNYHLYVRLGSVLRSLRCIPESASAYLRALDLNPAGGDANFNFGNLLYDANEFDRALEYYRRAAAVPNPNPKVTGSILSCLIKTCNWDDELMRGNPLDGRAGELLAPFTTLLLSYSNSEQLFYARRWSKEREVAGVSPVQISGGPIQAGKKIRVGYLSADFYEHATAYLITQLFEVHDREQFQIIGISYGPSTKSRVRQRLIDAFDIFLDVSNDDDETASTKIAEAKIDILVDLKGYTKNARPRILSWKPAPIIVSYLGYPGTLGMSGVDYIVADPVVLPFDEQEHYDENIVQLPVCYQVNDSLQEIEAPSTTRAEHGLPNDAFVFCCLNGNQKITRVMFATWMRILLSVPHGVLWLYRDNDAAVNNLRRAASAFGVDPSRLVFAPKIEHAGHLERYRHADLFLDTSPYNAHTTGSDALRAFVPILTLRGSTFASRVAESLLKTVGIPELVADDLKAYEAQACRLAHDSAAINALKERIAIGVRSGPLYDTRQFARGIEAAYRHMQKRNAAGLQPCPFAVAANGQIQEVNSVRIPR